MGVCFSGVSVKRGSTVLIHPPSPNLTLTPRIWVPIRPLQINLVLPFFLHNAGRRAIKTIGLQNLRHCICNIMPFVAAVTFVMYQKVHLLLNDIAAQGCIRLPERAGAARRASDHPEGAHGVRQDGRRRACVVLITYCSERSDKAPIC